MQQATRLNKYEKEVSKVLGTAKKSFSSEKALEILQNLPKRKFNESVDLAFNLGIDPRKSDQAVRGSVVLPNGTGKKVRVAVFTSAANTEKAQNAGADIVGAEDLAEKIKAGQMDFDIVLATPEAMRIVGQLGQILGPRGLMPNPKDGTVTTDIANAVKNAKMGQVRYRADKAGIVQLTIGKVDFTTTALIENMAVILSALKKAKPVSAKGVYFKKITISTTMGPGLLIDPSSLDL